MLFLRFQMGADRYAIDAGAIVEVLPLVGLAGTAGARGPAGLAGTLNYRGRFIPVVDLSQLMMGHPAERRLSTRILIADPFAAKGRLVGLIAEKVTTTERCERKQLVPAGVAPGEPGYLGPIARFADALVQVVELERVLSPSIGAPLVADPEEAA